MIDFPDEGNAMLDEAHAREWCEEHLDDFRATLPEETTRGAIREAAKAYIVAHQDNDDFAMIRETADGTNGLFVGLVITVMAEYMLELIAQS